MEPLATDIRRQLPQAVGPNHSVVSSSSSYFRIQFVVEGLLEHLSHNVFNGRQRNEGRAYERRRTEIVYRKNCIQFVESECRTCYSNGRVLAVRRGHPILDSLRKVSDFHNLADRYGYS